MSYEQIVYEVDDHVLRLTCNRPRYRNAQSRVLLEELDDAFARAAEDLDIRVIVLMGSGDHFSAGHDLGTPEEMADRDIRPRQEGLRGRFHHSREQFVNKTLRWRNVPKPTIAAVQGYCIFGGWMIASAMDIIFAADNAMFLGANFQYFSSNRSGCVVRESARLRLGSVALLWPRGVRTGQAHHTKPPDTLR